MTLAYQKAAASTASGDFRSHGSTFQSLLAHRRAFARRRIESAFAPEAGLEQSVSGRGIGIRRTPRASYVLHKDPDGSWFIDQWKQDAASGARPTPVSTPERGRASTTRDHADLCFIIEIS